MTSWPLLTTLIVCPFLVALLLWQTPSQQWTRILVLGATLLELLLSTVVVVAMETHHDGFQWVEQWPWIATLHIQYHVGVDGLSALLLLTTSVLFVGVVLASWKMLEREMPRAYFAMLLLLEGSTIGVFCALDTMLFFLFWELTILPFYFLVTLWGEGAQHRQAATRYTLSMLAGGVPLLFGFLFAALQSSADTPTFDLLDLLAHPLAPSQQTTLFLLLLAGFSIKIPLVPLHTWLPALAMEGPVGVGALLTGLKIGAYGLFRFALPLAPVAVHHYYWLLAALGVAGVLYGAIMALAQTNLRRLLAFASVSHVGAVVLGFASFTEQGTQGALFQLINFPLIAGGLFLMAGSLYRRFGSTDTLQLGGVARHMPLLTLFFFVLSLASIGVPLTSGFPAELLLIIGIFTAYKGAGLIVLVGGILGAGAVLRNYRGLFLGTARHAFGPDLLIHERLYILLFVLLVLIVGLFPMLVLDRIGG